MKIIYELIKDVKKRGLIPIRDVRVGVFYTAVYLEDGRLGVAATPHEFVSPSERENLDIFNFSPEDALEWALSSNPILSSIGIAYINALLQPVSNAREGDLLDFFKIKDGANVGIIGYFAPFIKKLEGRVNLFVFERREKMPGLLPDWSFPLMVQDLQYLIITGSTFVNKTIDSIYEGVKGKDIKVAIAGPTTPMSECLLSYFDILSGVHITNPEGALKAVSMGGGTKAVLMHARKINLMR